MTSSCEHAGGSAEARQSEVIPGLFEEIEQLAAEYVESMPDNEIEARLQHVLGPSHRRQELDSTSSDALVRPYFVTNGRARPASDGIDPSSIIVATVKPAAVLNPEPEHVSILELCQAPSTVTRVAERLGLPMDVARILLNDLLEVGAIVVDSTETVARMSEWRSKIGIKNSRAQVDEILLPKCAER